MQVPSPRIQVFSSSHETCPLMKILYSSFCVNCILVSAYDWFGRCGHAITAPPSSLNDLRLQREHCCFFLTTYICRARYRAYFANHPQCYVNVHVSTSIIIGVAFGGVEQRGQKAWQVFCVDRVKGCKNHS